jgi:hypothetical protein
MMSQLEVEMQLIESLATTREPRLASLSRRLRGRRIAPLSGLEIR